MTRETDATRAAIVDAWESATDSKLEELFAKYLYRIARWSRGEDARSFTTREIDSFKGISPATPMTPASTYHYAAQQAVPLLTGWSLRQGSPSEKAERDAFRSRFQLDAPLVAGRAFFEMVGFMLNEVERLRAAAFGLTSDGDDPPEVSELAPYASGHRYQYVAELFVCALLYFTNKYAEDDFATSAGAALRLGLHGARRLLARDLALGEQLRATWRHSRRQRTKHPGPVLTHPQLVEQHRHPQPLDPGAGADPGRAR